MKKEIVFVEYVPNIINLRIAKVLKSSGKYKTTLISFTEDINKKVYEGAFDKMLILDIKHKINMKNLIYVFKKLKSREGKKFMKEIKELDPYLFQITGPDLFTLWIMFITKDKPKIYFAYDLWDFYGKKFSFKNLGIKENFQKIIERVGLNICDGILHKGGSEKELELLSYKVSKPDLFILPGCLDEWTFAPKKKNGKGLHLVYAGGPLRTYDYSLPYLNIVRGITSQGIHFHTYGRCADAKDTPNFIEEERNNKYYHFHKKIGVDELNKEMSEYDYGVNLDFYDTSILNPLWPKMSIANRIFSYIEAGIPVITSASSEGEIVKRRGVGFYIGLEDLNNLKKIIIKQDYKKLQENIKKTQKELSWNKNMIFELERFYEKIVGKST